MNENPISIEIRRLEAEIEEVRGFWKVSAKACREGEKLRDELRQEIERLNKEIKRQKSIIVRLCDDDYGDALTRADAKIERLNALVKDMLPWIEGNGIKSLDCTKRLKIVLRAREAAKQEKLQQTPD